MAFNPYIQSDLSHERAQGANVGDIREGFRWDGSKWNQEGGGGANSGQYSFFGSSPSNSGGGGFFENQRKQEEDYMNRYKTALGSQESLTSMNERFGKELNLPALRQNAFTMQQALKSTPQVQSEATRGYDVNANQLQRIIAQKMSELSPAAQEATSQAQFAENQLGERLRLGQADQEKAMKPFEMEAKFLGERMAREFTGYSQDKQRELDMLMAKMNQQQQLTLAEQNRAHELAMAERNFEQQKQLNQQQFQQNLQLKSSSSNDSVGELQRAMDLERFRTDEAIRQHNATKGASTPPPLFNSNILGMLGGGMSEQKPLASKPSFANQAMSQMGGGSALNKFISARGGNKSTGQVAGASSSPLSIFLAQRGGRG